MPKTRATLLAAWAGVGLAVLAVTRADRAAQGGDEQTAARGYVGAQVCQNCHQEEHALWTGSSHFHTFERATRANLPADVVAGSKVSHGPGSTQFRVDGERFLAETIGPEGTPERYPLTHVVGRMRVRMFISTLPDGRQQVLPAMMEAPTEHWFDYADLLFGAGGTDWNKPPVVEPGDGSFWTGTQRSWDARCAYCHVSGFEFRRPGADGKGARYRMRQPGVDCESCHGPGADHVEFREAKMEGDDPMVAFDELAHRAALGVCLQCHLTGEVVDSDFRIGNDIFEHKDPVLLVDPERIDASGRVLELIYDGTPISVSRCVDAGKLTCITCHDPHGSSQPSQLRADPNNDKLCTGCHEAVAADLAQHTHHEAGGSGSRCVNCHMPFLQVERGHGVVADHAISTPRFGLKGLRTAQNACVWCHQGGVSAPDGVPRVEPDRLEKQARAWYGSKVEPLPWMQALGAARAGEKDSATGLLRILEDPAANRIVRASAAELLGRQAPSSPLAVLAYAQDKDSLVRRRSVAALARLSGDVVDRALMRALADPSRAVRIAAARAALEGWARVQANAALLAAILPVLQGDAEDGPADDMRWFRLGAARSIAGDDAGALVAYERVVELDPFATNTRTEVERLRTRLGKR